MKNRLCCLLAVLASGIVVGQTADSPSSPSQDKVECVKVLRDVNTAEARYEAKNHHFGNLSELANSGDLRSSSAAQLDNSSAAKFRILVSPDGKSYQVSALHRTDNVIWAFFSDESGLIYQAEPIR